jgi:superfamily II DNA helicase RecQ
MSADLYSQLRQVLPNDIEDDYIRDMANRYETEDLVQQLDEMDLLSIYVEDPEELTQEQIEELIALEGALNE